MNLYLFESFATDFTVVIFSILKLGLLLKSLKRLSCVLNILVGVNK